MNVLFNGCLCVCGWFDEVDRMEKKRKEKKRSRDWACPFIDGNNNLMDEC